MIYKSYGMIKQSPTVGLYFFADDYIRFVSNLKRYINGELKFIKLTSSKWYQHIKQESNIGTYPIGVIDDIEIFFLHYHSEKKLMKNGKEDVKEYIGRI